MTIMLTPAGRRTDPRVIDRIQYKSRTAFSDNKRTHLFLIDVDDERASPQQLTDGRYYDHAISWSPRGDEIAFLSNHEIEPDANNNSDIFAVSTNGRVRQITTTAGCEYEPQWSPDGRWIAYTATRRDVTSIDSVAEDTHVWIIDSGGGRGREMTLSQDRRARSPRWASDSRSIYFLAGDRGKTSIYEIQLPSAKVQGLPLYTIAGEAGGPFGIVDPRISRDETSTGNQKYQIGSFSIAARTITAPRSGVTSAW